MDERNIKGVIICVIMLLGLIIALILITMNDKKRVNSIDVSEAEKIIEEKTKKDSDEKEKEPEEEKKERSTFNNFELSYNRSDAPIASYYVKVGADRLLTSDVDEKCAREDCVPNKEHNELRLTEYEYKLVIDLYNRLYTDEWPENTKEMFIVSVSRMANGNKEMYDSTGNGWGLYKIYDTDNDGRVLYREYGRYVLEVFDY